MKRILKIIIITVFILVLSACSSEKTYKEKGLEITMDKGFYYKNHSQADVYFTKGNITFTALKEDYAKLESQDLNIDSDVTDYMENIFANLGSEYPIYDYNGLKYFIYGMKDNNIVYAYLVTVHKGNDAFWICSLSTTEEEFAQYQESFLKWSSTVKVK